MYRSIVVGLGQIGLTYDLDPKRVKPSSHTLAYCEESNIQLIAVFDPRESQQELLHSIAPEVPYFSSLNRLQDLPNPDIVSVCTPPEIRLNVIKELLSYAAPKLIFCEKPIVSNLNEIEEFKQLIHKSSCKFLPNLSRRWSTGMQQIKSAVDSKTLGSLLKIHTRYTRGVFNTGSHMFDLIKWFAGKIEEVQVVNQIATSSDRAHDPTYTFLFSCENGVTGFAEGFSDQSYYMFEMDFYFETGKVEVRESGNKVFYYEAQDHPLFSGFQSLHLDKTEDGKLFESFLKNAVGHIVRVLDRLEEPICNLDDGLYPIFVAHALLRSSASKNWEKVTVESI